MTQASLLADLSQAYTAGALGMRNRIINGACRVQQRGNVVLNAGVTGYGAVDRFYAFSNGAQINVRGDFQAPSGDLAAAASVMAAGNTGLAIGQKIESLNTADLNNQPFTVTAWIYSDVAFNAGTFGCNVFVWTTKDDPTKGGTWVGPTTYERLTTAGNWSFVRAKFNALPNNASNGFAIEFGFPAHANNQNCAVGTLQAEIGLINTPFERRPVGLEIALCQRYFTRGSQRWCTAGLTNYFGGMIPLPVPMRVAPTLSFVDNSGNPNKYSTALQGDNQYTVTGGNFLFNPPNFPTQQIEQDFLYSTAPGNWLKFVWTANAEFL